MVSQILNLAFFSTNEQHWNFSTVLVSSNFYLLQNIFGAPKYHNLGLLCFYEIMSLENFKILPGRNFEN